MKLWILTTFYTALLLTLSGCVTPSPKQEPKIDSTLPVVKLTKYGIAADMNAIGFEWEYLSDPRVNGIYIYKLDTTSGEGDPVFYTTVDNRFKTHYVDTKITPDTKYSYYFKTYSDDAESIESRLTTVNSLPILQSVAWIQSIQNMPRSAKIIWRPHTNQKVKSYLIERSTLENPQWNTLTIIDGRLNAEYIDGDLKDKHTYKYRVRVVTYDNITSTPSEIVTVVTKALPQMVTGIKASRDLPKKIQLNWAKSSIKDFSHYNIYRSEKIELDYELIARTTKNVFVDNIDEDAKQYFYRVSVEDKDHLESNSNEHSIQGVTLEKPTAPALVEAKLVDGKVKLLWNNSDPRTRTYTLVKSYKKGWFEEINEEFEGLTTEKFTDSNIEPGASYRYYVLSVDENSIKSEPSIEVELKSPKLADGGVVNNGSEQAPTNTRNTPQQNSDEVIVTPMNDFK